MQNVFISLDVMKQFDHPHIIRLIGLCMEPPPIYIIMELAPHGEVRPALHWMDPA
jgi:focal adhesion kinase 1